MPAALPLHPHLSLSELRERFKNSEGIEKIRWQALMLKMKGWQHQTISEVVCHDLRWITKLIHRYNKEGPEGMRDRRRDNGADPKVPPALQGELKEAVLTQSPPSGGLWTGEKVQQWLAERGVKIHPSTALEYLHRLELSKQRPRPRHAAADRSDQETVKKGGSPAP